MEQIKMRLTNAVAAKLAAAPHSTAKAELVEELSDNLYQRYQDLTAAGEGPEQAYERALEELGDVDELLDYLSGLSPEEPLPRLTLDPKEEWERPLDDLLRNVNDIVKGALEQAKRATRQAGALIRQERRDGRSWEIHMDGYDDDHGEHPYGEDHEETYSPQERARGGRPVNSPVVAGQGLQGIDVQTVNGDVSLQLWDGEDVLVGGDAEELEVSVTQDQMLVIRQGRTAASSFFFGRGLSAADVELKLPRQRWALIRISAANGDVSLGDGVEAEELSVKSISGDVDGRLGKCSRASVKSVSGDLDVQGSVDELRAESVSGDIQLRGWLGRAAVSTTSGDAELQGSLREGRLSSMSGDVYVESAALPQGLELSSKSGDCTLRLPDAGGFVLRARTTSGMLRSEFRLDEEERKGMFRYQGGGPTYSLASVSGDLVLKRG